MKNPATISVKLDGGNISVDLTVEEFHPVEPSAYVLDPGWTCLCPCCEREYFVSTSGLVYMQPENVVVGTAPALVAEAARMEKLIDEASEHMD